MTRYDEPRGIRLRPLLAVLIALAIGLLIGRGIAGGGEGPRGGTGPDTARSGAPTGYPRDRDGAASAAANLSAALAYSIARGPSRVGEVAAEVGTDRYASRVSAAYDGRQVLDPSARVLFRAVPITYRVLEYSGEEAAVRVWSASILASDDTSPGAATFKTATIGVRWTDGGWRIDDVRDATPGPTPRTEAPSAGARFITELTHTERFRVQP